MVYGLDENVIDDDSIVLFVFIFVGYFIMLLNDKVLLGFGVFLNFGFFIEFNDDYVVGFIVGEIEIVIVNMNVSVLYKINE